MFASSVTAAGTYSMVYMTFPDWDHTADATFYYMDQTPGFAGYKAAPQVFFFAPQNKWYLVFQSGPPSFSTNDDIDDPTGWTAGAELLRRRAGHGQDQTKARAAGSTSG